jgi:hypothetical protein
VLFDISFFILALWSIQSLIQSIKGLRQPMDLTKVGITGLTLVIFFLTAVFAFILASQSEFWGKYVLLLFLLASLAADYLYFHRAENTDHGSNPHPSVRRRWYWVIDNMGWVAAVALLYFA